MQFAMLSPLAVANGASGKARFSSAASESSNKYIKLSSSKTISGEAVSLSIPDVTARAGVSRQNRSRLVVHAGGQSLKDRIASGEFGDITPNGPSTSKASKPVRQGLAKLGGAGRAIAKVMAGITWNVDKNASKRMPEATGDIREIVGEPVFIPLYTLFRVYGPVFRLSFGPKSFVVVSDPMVAKHILRNNAENYSKGLLAEILEFVMGTGLIPADAETWRIRRKLIAPSLHRKYVEAMVQMFGDCAVHGCSYLEKEVKNGKTVEMENFFSRFALDIIGKAVFNYDFDSLTHDDPVIKAVYTTLREAEHRSVNPFPYWNIPGVAAIVPRQRENTAALKIINDTLNELISKAKQIVEESDEEFVEEYLNSQDPSILNFLIASGDDVTSKQLRDDLMTLLIAGHETTAAVLTWTFHLLAQHPDIMKRVQAEVDAKLNSRNVSMADFKELKFTTRVINESMRLYPQPPVLLRRALGDDLLGKYEIKAGTDLFISVWNIHRSPAVWDRPDEFDPDRFPIDSPMPTEITEDFAYLPFGGGQRKCVGDQFALFESVVALSMLLRRFDFEMAPNAPEVGMETGATIHTTEGLWMKLTPRLHAHDTDRPVKEVSIAA